MATHDYVLDNAAGAAFRADLNNALAAIVSQNSNLTEPATTYAYMWWADTTTGILKRRNAANSGWISVMSLTTGLVIGTDVQAYDATILKSADIGSAVQAYDAQTAKYNAATPNFTGDLQVGGVSVGTKIVPQNSQSAAYTCVLADSGKHLLHPSADTTARTFTIPANSSVPYPIGTAITFVNQNGAGTVTIAITTDTMRLAGAGTTGNRTLAADGIATALKITSTEWVISGTGLT